MKPQSLSRGGTQAHSPVTSGLHPLFAPRIVLESFFVILVCVVKLFVHGAFWAIVSLGVCMSMRCLNTLASLVCMYVCGCVYICVCTLALLVCYVCLDLLQSCV